MISAGTIQSSLILDISKYAESLKKAGSLLKTFHDEGISTGQKLQTVGNTMQSVGMSATKYMTLPLVTAGAASVKAAATFETSSKKVETIADTTVKSMAELNKGVINLSNETGQSAAGLNEALYQTISATGDTVNALDYTRIANQAAIGGFTDSATAVDGLTSVLNTYGLKGAASMQMVSDQMLTTQNYGKTTFGELAQSIGQVAPITAQLKIGTDELFASIATLTKNGINTSSAIIGMKAALANVIKPTTEAADAAEALGIDFSASALQAQGLTGFLGGIREKLEQAAPEYVKLSDQVTANKNAMAALEDQGKKNTNQYKVLAEETKNMEGQMEAMAGAADSTIGGFSSLFGSVEGLNSMLVLTSINGSKDMQGALSAMANSAGATERAYIQLILGVFRRVMI